jgi:catechol 2,3-dioxygenase-like lactoylglutathione lyase family enzyme
MRVLALDHVNIRTARLAETVRFYIENLGLTRGRLPSTPATSEDADPRGAWLCDATGRAIFHVIRDVEDAKAAAAPIDHLALECVDREGFIARLTAGGVPFEIADYPKAGIRQLIVRDPNGIKIELGFRTEPAQAETA